jgi:hypothetical protein
LLETQAKLQIDTKNAKIVQWHTTRPKIPFNNKLGAKKSFEC